MKILLGEEYEAYLDSFAEEPVYGLRVNTLKVTVEEFLRKAADAGWELQPVPWVSNGFYYPKEKRPARHPWYYSGLYYLQEPSAMTPASRLPIEPGDKVLDLCAAPGGKSTELAARLSGTGLLFSNDISNSRAKALLKNLELFGSGNICVSSEPPEKLAKAFPAFFDKILVDAPCSGEGMFRRDP
ncbi:MAG: SAM-dependent methyltransferase, partial [Otoolea sp.]